MKNQVTSVKLIGLNADVIWRVRTLEPISKLLSAVLGCKARGTALSAKTVLDVLQYACEPFLPPALPTSFSLELASKSVLKWVLNRPEKTKISVWTNGFGMLML